MIWKRLALALAFGIIIVGLLTLLPQRYAFCGPYQDCPSSQRSGWPMAFKFISEGCGGGSDGNTGCAIIHVNRYDYRSLVFDMIVWTGVGFAVLSLINSAKKHQRSKL